MHDTNLTLTLHGDSQDINYYVDYDDYFLLKTMLSVHDKITQVLTIISMAVLLGLSANQRSGCNKMLQSCPTVSNQTQFD